ncbi:MAG TPA: ABC transporter permease [Bryobacteraceae bacterium]|nr:ABC transporter permease [Bryobacteraceae bacterium]
MWNDLRYAFRTLLRERGFATMAVLSLAVGIGANTAIFSVVNGVLLRPLSYRDPGRLFSIQEVIPKLAHLYPRLPVNFAHYVEWRKHCSALQSLAVVRPTSPSLTGVGEPEMLEGARVTASIFPVLGIQPQLGRGFLEEEEPEGHDQAAVISDSLWRRRFSADPRIVGRKIMLDGKPHVVVGVLPPGFQFSNSSDFGNVPQQSKVDVFVPAGQSKDDLEELNGDYNWMAIARLRPGVTQQKATAELNVIQADISRRVPEKLDLHVSVAVLQDDIVGRSRQGLLVVLGAVGAVLLILCANLANLSLARAAGRARESAIRTALGASRARLVKQTLTESLMLAAIGGILGIALAAWGTRFLLAAAPPNLPRLDEVSLDGRVLAFALLISLATGVVFGILPALRSAGAHPQEALKSGNYTTTESRRGVRLRSVLVAVEAALSAALLITAGLLISSFVHLMHVDKGFNIERVLSVEVKMPPAKYTSEPQQIAFYDRVLDKIRPLPGVETASFVSALPLQGETWVDLAAPEGDQRPLFERPMVNVRFVTPDYFQTLRIPFREGATFNNSQRNRKVVIISQDAAQRLWPGKNAIGRRLIHNETLEEVVGVTADIRSTALDKDPVLMLYDPYWQRPRTAGSLLVRTAMGPKAIAAGVREVIHQVDADVPVPAMQTLEEVMSKSVAERRFQMMLIIAFAAAALALAGFGIYGVVSYSVARRRTEMGIRMALGAGAGSLQWMVLWQGVQPVVAGLAVGIMAALAAGRVLSSLLFQVSPHDPLTIGGVAFVLLVVSVAAALVPARRATGIDPMKALRFE